MGTSWDAGTYDRSSESQQAWHRRYSFGLEGIAADAAVLDVGCDAAPELVGWSPWLFAGPHETKQRLWEAGFTETRCWLEERPTYPKDLAAFVPTSILAAHLARLPR